VVNNKIISNKKHDQRNFVKIFRSVTIDGMDSPENNFPKRTSAQNQAVSKMLHRVIIKFLYEYPVVYLNQYYWCRLSFAVCL